MTWVTCSTAARTRTDIGATPAWLKWMCSSQIGKRARASSGSMLLTPELIEQGLQRYHVVGEATGGHGQRLMIERPGREGFVEPRPAPVPGFELSVGEAAFDLNHARPQELQAGFVQLPAALEVEPDLDPALTAVVPRL